jgi:hypothetical protein
MTPLNVCELREAFGAAIAARRVQGEPGGNTGIVAQDDALLNLAGAVRAEAALGIPLGDETERRHRADQVLAFQRADGAFGDGELAGHKNCIALAALHLLGSPPPKRLAPLAPVAIDALDQWIEGLPWDSTHKRFWGEVSPVLASGLVGPDWCQRFMAGVTRRLDHHDSRATWCRPDDPSWRVISCIYHVVSAFDAGGLPYPEPERLRDRLLELRWDEAGDHEHRTFCTDGDWAWCLLRLAEQVPMNHGEVMRAIRNVSARRIKRWRADPQKVLAEPTRHFANHLWAEALFRNTIRDHYTGPPMVDVLNAPWLLRLQ